MVKALKWLKRTWVSLCVCVFVFVCVCARARVVDCFLTIRSARVEEREGGGGRESTAPICIYSERVLELYGARHICI